MLNLTPFDRKLNKTNRMVFEKQKVGKNWSDIFELFGQTNLAKNLIFFWNFATIFGQNPAPMIHFAHSSKNNIMSNCDR